MRVFGSGEHELMLSEKDEWARGDTEALSRKYLRRARV